MIALLGPEPSRIFSRFSCSNTTWQLIFKTHYMPFWPLYNWPKLCWNYTMESCLLSLAMFYGLYFILFCCDSKWWDFVCPVGPVWINKPNVMVCWITNSQDVVLLFHVTFSVIMYLLFTVELMALLQLDFHYGDVIMGTMASQITSLTIVYSTIYSGADQRKYQSSAALAFVRWIHRGPVNSPHKWLVTRKIFPFDDVIMLPDKEIGTIVRAMHFHPGQWCNNISTV